MRFIDDQSFLGEKMILNMPDYFTTFHNFV